MLALKLERLVYCTIYRKTQFDSLGGGMTNVGFEIGEVSILCIRGNKMTGPEVIKLFFSSSQLRHAHLS